MYVRGRYGVEFTPEAPRPETHWLLRASCVVAVIVIVIIINALWRRIRSRVEEPPIVVLQAGEATPPVTTNAAHAAVHNSAPTNHSESAVREVDYANRSPRVRNLLLRLAEAEKRHDVEMAATTIEQLRATPGAADLDDTLARRLGALNMRRLFVQKSAQWTVQAEVQRGHSATRIAYEHGSTYDSLAKLNGGNLDRLRIGQKLTVMNHPRFNLVVTRRSRTADLSLNGRFFKRYYLTGDVTGAEGSFETPERFRGFCTEHGVRFRPEDRAELEMLLPKGVPAFIKDI